MKKGLSVLVGFLLVLLLAACNITAEPVDKKDGKTKIDKNEKSELTLEQVFEKTTEASKNLKSFKMKMDMKQDMSSDQEEGNMKFNSIIEMDVVTEPMAFYQKMSMEMPESAEKIDMESYFTKDGMYFYDPASQTWMKFPTDAVDQLLQMSNQQTNPGAEIEKLKQFVDDFSFKQDKESYILLLNASGEKFTEFLKDTIKKTLPAGMGESEEVFENIKINKVDYEIVIDKKTFYPKDLNVNMDMEIKAEGQSVKIAQEIKGQYLEYNQIKEITVPQKVLESAVETDL